MAFWSAVPAYQPVHWDDGGNRWRSMRDRWRAISGMA